MDTEDKILERIDISDLPEEMKYFAEFIGLETVKTLMKISGGSRVSIPMASSFKMIALERYLKSMKCDGDYYFVKKTAREFNVHENTVRKLIKEIEN